MSRVLRAMLRVARQGGPEWVEFVRYIRPETKYKHGNLGGLESDDHGQYHTDFRGDARYFMKMPGEPNGFEDRSDCVLSFDEGTRTLTLTGSYTFWCNGIRFTSTGDTFVISDTGGDHFIYYDNNGDLQESPSFLDEIFSTFAYVVYIYWDAANNVAVPWAMNEQHGSTMDSKTHQYLHLTRATVYQSGLDLSVTADGGGAIDLHARVASTAGVIWDEDITHDITSRVATDNIAVIWRAGSAWRVDKATTFPVLVTTTRPDYNEDVGGIWQRTEVGNNDYVLAHIFAVPGPNEGEGGLIAVMGQAEYATKNAARLGATTEMTALSFGGFPAQEIKGVATLIFECKDAFANSVNAQIVTTDEGDDFIDWRFTDFRFG